MLTCDNIVHCLDIGCCSGKVADNGCWSIYNHQHNSYQICMVKGKLRHQCDSTYLLGKFHLHKSEHKIGHNTFHPVCNDHHLRNQVDILPWCKLLSLHTQNYLYNLVCKPSCVYNKLKLLKLGSGRKSVMNYLSQYWFELQCLDKLQLNIHSPLTHVYPPAQSESL